MTKQGRRFRVRAHHLLLGLLLAVCSVQSFGAAPPNNHPGDHPPNRGHSNRFDNAGLAVSKRGGQLPSRENATEIPEPGTLALLSIGLAGIGFSRRKKQS